MNGMSRNIITKIRIYASKLIMVWRIIEKWKKSVLSGVSNLILKIRHRTIGT